MVDYYWDWNRLADAASKLKEVEKKLTNEQLEYLNEYYRNKKMPHPYELQSISKKWNMKDKYFFVDLEDWFFGRRMAEREREQRLHLASKLGA